MIRQIIFFALAHRVARQKRNKPGTENGDRKAGKKNGDILYVGNEKYKKEIAYKFFRAQLTNIDRR